MGRFDGRIALVTGAGGGIGYSDIPRSLGIEYDTWFNGELGDPNGNHVGIDLGGTKIAAGVVDAFREAGLRIFGPVQAAARLESSKDFAKQFMLRHGLPTAKYETFADAAKAKAYIEATQAAGKA